MSKFNVGDRVKLKQNYSNFIDPLDFLSERNLRTDLHLLLSDKIFIVDYIRASGLIALNDCQYLHPSNLFELVNKTENSDISSLLNKPKIILNQSI